jgi:hypothetical protein
MRFIPDNLLARWLTVFAVVILAVVPFHATLTVWLSSILGQYTLLRLWKEFLLAILVIGTLMLLVKNPSLRQKIWKDPFIRPILILVGVYVVLHCIAGGVAWLRGDVTLQALGYGFVSNLRFLVFFSACIVIGSYIAPWLKAHWKKVLLWPAAVVIGFGLLQVFVLPIDFLKHVGYGPETSAPYIAVDQKDDYARIQSTLRGPNPLGAYLVVIVTALIGLLLAARAQSWKFAAATVLTLTVLYGTYSRSAWIGVIVSVAVLLWLMAGSAKIRKLLLVTAAGFMLIGAATVFVLRNNDHVQNILFHTNEHSLSEESSNEARAGVLLDGVDDVFVQPFGGGVGTAGPASVYNDGNARIAENYFVQIAQEAGIIGVAVFVAICYMAGRALWQVRAFGVLPIILLASLVGISAVNMVSHAWADDTLAYIWWGFAGLVLGAAGLKGKEYETGNKKQKTI